MKHEVLDTIRIGSSPSHDYVEVDSECKADHQRRAKPGSESRFQMEVPHPLLLEGQEIMLDPVHDK